jgi:hypothetical protein
MKSFGRALAGALGVALTAAGALMFAATVAGLRRSNETFGTDLFVTGFFLAVVIGGLALIHFVWPGSLVRLPKRVSLALLDPALLYNPLVHGCLIYLGSAVLFRVVPGPAAILVALAGTTLYAVGSPVVIALRPRWWLNAALSILAFVVLIGALPATAEAVTHRRIGEDAMALLFPFMLFPVMLVASLVFRVVSSRRVKGELT